MINIKYYLDHINLVFVNIIMAIYIHMKAVTLSLVLHRIINYIYLLVIGHRIIIFR